MMPLDGPRRVLVSEGPKVSSLKSTSGIGARRVSVNGPEGVPPPSKPTMPAGSGLKAPVKYATVGPAALSAIPKPVSSRSAGSKIPAPSASGSSKQRNGVSAEGGAQSKSFFGRRVF